MTDEERKESEDVPVFIDGETISLVPQNSKHVDLYVKWLNDPKVRKFARWDTPRRVEDVKKWFEPQQGRVSWFISFEIWHKKDKKPIGQVGLGWIDWINGWANAFAYIGEPEYWGQGITTEATQLLIEYAFNELNLNKLHGGIIVENIGSWSVAEKCGFKFEGIQKHEMYLDGKYHDAKTYHILKEDWINSNK